MSSGKRLNDVRGAQKANMTRESHTKTSCLTWRYQTVKILESSFRAFRPRLKTKLKHWLNISCIIRYGFLTRNTNKSLVWQLSKIGWYLHEHASIVFSFCWICSVNVEYYVAFLFALAVSTKYLDKAWSVNEIFIAVLRVLHCVITLKRPDHGPMIVIQTQSPGHTCTEFCIFFLK